MTCAVCGTPLPGGANKCPRCGTFIAASPSSGRNLPPTVFAPANQSAPQAQPRNHPSANQGASQVPPTAFAPGSSPSYPGNQEASSVPPTVFAPGHQNVPQTPHANPGNPYPPAYNGMSVNQNGYQQQDMPPLPQSVPSLPPQYMHTNENDGQKKSRVLIVGIIALLVILLIGGSAVLLTRSHTLQNKPAASTTATTSTTVTAIATKAPSTSNALPNEKNPYPPGTGTLVLKDPMRNNSHGYLWQQGTATNGTTCRFTGGQYHVLKASGSALCIPQSPAIAWQNLTFEANLTLQSGTYMGLATRIDPQRGTGYLFVIGTDGTYAINKVNIKVTGSGQIQQLSQGFSPSLPIGTNQVKMAVVVRGTQLSLFVNNQQIISINDSKLNNVGGIGVFVNGNSALNLAVSNVRVWKL